MEFRFIHLLIPNHVACRSMIGRVGIGVNLVHNAVNRANETEGDDSEITYPFVISSQPKLCLISKLFLISTSLLFVSLIVPCSTLALL